jgi:hypothetical protein
MKKVIKLFEGQLFKIELSAAPVEGLNYNYLQVFDYQLIVFEHAFLTV